MTANGVKTHGPPAPALPAARVLSSPLPLTEKSSATANQGSTDAKKETRVIRMKRRIAMFKYFEGYNRRKRNG